MDTNHERDFGPVVPQTCQAQGDILFKHLGATRDTRETGKKNDVNSAVEAQAYPRNKSTRPSAHDGGVAHSVNFVHLPGT